MTHTFTGSVQWATRYRTVAAAAAVLGAREQGHSSRTGIETWCRRPERQRRRCSRAGRAGRRWRRFRAMPPNPPPWPTTRPPTPTYFRPPVPTRVATLGPGGCLRIHPRIRLQQARARTILLAGRGRRSRRLGAHRGRCQEVHTKAYPVAYQGPQRAVYQGGRLGQPCRGDTSASHRRRASTFRWATAATATGACISTCAPRARRPLRRGRRWGQVTTRFMMFAESATIHLRGDEGYSTVALMCSASSVSVRGARRGRRIPAWTLGPCERARSAGRRASWWSLAPRHPTHRRRRRRSYRPTRTTFNGYHASSSRMVRGNARSATRAFMPTSSSTRRQAHTSLRCQRSSARESVPRARRAW
mmetsp:Transcript_4935/g.10670  ORF Transcript_4935/g.10670 Transcript_4935/m.10670 type:complete len:360 (+) Transcript_4935:552-1631(+)